MRFRILVVVALSCLALTLVYCGKPIKKGSNLTITNTEAQKSFELRLKKTEEVRKQLDSIRDAIKPIENIFNDIGRALNLTAELKLEGKVHEKLQTLLRNLQKILREATEDVVTFLPDGSWEFVKQVTLQTTKEETPVVERNPSEPLPQASALVTENKTYQLRFAGRRVGNQDEVVLTLTDLSSGESEIIARGTAENKKIDFAFYPKALERFLENHLFPEERVVRVDLSKTRQASGECLVKVRKDEQSVRCQEMEVEIQAYNLFFHPLELVRDKSGLNAIVRATLEDEKHRAVAEISLEAHPGEKTKLEAKVVKK